MLCNLHNTHQFRVLTAFWKVTNSAHSRSKPKCFDQCSMLQCVFLVYCMVPTSWNGSVFIYHQFIRPFVLKYQTKVDDALDQMSDTAQNIINEGNAQTLYQYFNQWHHPRTRDVVIQHTSLYHTIWLYHCNTWITI